MRRHFFSTRYDCLHQGSERTTSIPRPARSGSTVHAQRPPAQTCNRQRPQHEADDHRTESHGELRPRVPREQHRDEHQRPTEQKERRQRGIAREHRTRLHHHRPVSAVAAAAVVQLSIERHCCTTDTPNRTSRAIDPAQSDQLERCDAATTPGQARRRTPTRTTACPRGEVEFAASPRVNAIDASNATSTLSKRE